MEAEYSKFVDSLIARVKPASIDMSLTYFVSQVSGKKEDFAQSAAMEMKYNAILSDKAIFARLKQYKESNLIKDELKARELDLLYLSFLGMQVDTAKLNEMTKEQTAISEKYNNFRAKVGNKEYTDNEVEDILKTSKDSKMLQDAWIAHKKIGPVVAQDIIKLVKLRNEVAKELGYKNYHDMSLRLNEQDPEVISKLFDELDNLTKDAFVKEKAKMDEILAAGCKIKPADLMPWHYQNRFFQEAPKIYNIDLDVYYKGQDIMKNTEAYYKGLGMPMDDLAAKSDLYEKPGKCQHAFMIDIDRDSRDIRVLCNVKPSREWQETTLHEFGHALYEKYLDASLPWMLKQPAHIFTTEAIAMMFGRFASNPQWMHDMLGVSAADQAKITDATNKTLRLTELVFSRWSQVMYRFEKGMYENPDQDLNKLWWDLVEKYQMIKKPAGRNEPDWASKIHIATSPCYYHNYHLGELFASQLYFTIADKVLHTQNTKNLSWVNKPEVGKFLIDNVFSVGSKYYWDDMIEKATGEKLTAKWYAKQFVQ
jgi:peptidyl-dipeptidase A